MRSLLRILFYISVPSIVLALRTHKNESPRPDLFRILFDIFTLCVYLSVLVVLRTHENGSTLPRPHYIVLCIIVLCTYLCQFWDMQWGPSSHKYPGVWGVIFKFLFLTWPSFFNLYRNFVRKGEHLIYFTKNALSELSI